MTALGLRLLPSRATPLTRARVWLTRIALGLTLPVLMVVGGFHAAAWLLPGPVDPGPPPPATLLTAHDGRLLLARTGADQRWHLAGEAGNPWFDAAIRAVEDHRQAAHGGVDWLAAGQAAGSNLGAGRTVRGASTLAMQVARLRQPAARSLGAKAREAVAGLQLTRQLGSDGVAREWAQRAPMGGNLVGAQAGAWRWFGKPLAECSLGECALLAGLPQSPTRLRPDRNPEAARSRRDHVLERMRDTGACSAAQAERARAEALPIGWQPLPDPHRYGAGAPLLALAMQRGGGRYRTTIDLDIQHRAHALTATALEAQAADAAALLVVRVADAAVLGAVSISPGSPWLDCTAVRRSTGSTLKPFIVAEALAQGWLDLDRPVIDAPRAWQGWAPGNSDGARTSGLSAGEALALSRNLPFLDMLERAGSGRVAGLCQALGLRGISGGAQREGLSLAVGGAQASPRELAAAYAALARGGRAAPLRWWADVPPDLAIDPALDAQSAYRVLDACAVIERTAVVAPAALPLDPAWKTGTAGGNRDAWCVAATPRLVVVAWLGRLDGRGDPGLIGADAAAPLALELLARIDRSGPRFSDLVEPDPQPARSAPIAAPRGPVIIVPRDGSRMLGGGTLVLQADTGGDRHWFANGRHLGQGPQLRWRPPPGTWELRCVDRTGRGATVRIQVD